MRELGGAEKINSKGLMATLRSLVGKASPFHVLSFEQKLEICLRTIRAVQTVWPKLWGSEKHVLSTARGVNAVLYLYIRGVNFNRALGGSFEEKAIVQALMYGQQCKWTTGAAENLTSIHLADRLDGAIGRGCQAAVVSENLSVPSQSADPPTAS
jgi:hypothetical protein